MSDFGIVITIKKNSGSFSNADKTNISRLLAEFAASGDYEDISENFSTLDDGDGNSVFTRFTEYYDDDDSDEIRTLQKMMTFQKRKKLQNSYRKN